MKLAEHLEELGITDISVCVCGAYTLEINEVNCCVHKDNLYKHFPDIDQELFKKQIKKTLTNTYRCCDWCVNKWGLDLCACGSGETPHDCKEGWKDYCGRPGQVAGEETSRSLWR